MEGIGMSDAKIQTMDKTNFEREEDFMLRACEPFMVPRDVDPAPPVPPAPPFGLSQDVRYQFRSPEYVQTVKQKPIGYNKTPPIHQQMMTGSPERAQSEFRDLEQKVRTNSIMIDSLKDAVQEINNNIVSMEVAFTKTLADSNRDIRSLGNRMTNVEESLNGLVTQMGEMRYMLENLMHVTTENNNGSRNGPETIQVTPVSHIRSGAGFSPEERDRSLSPHSSSHRERRNDTRELGQSSFTSSQGPKVPKFDGKSPFVPWLCQFRAVAKAHCWDDPEKAVHLVAALEGSSTSLLHGVTGGQMDNFGFLVERLRGRYDPVGRESTFRAQLTTRTRRHNESADEFAEAIALLAQRAHPNYEISGEEEDPVTSCIVDKFCSGQCNPELSTYLSLYPSRVLTELIGTCVRWEATQTRKPYKPVDSMHAVRDTTNHPRTLTMEDVEAFARQNGLTVRPAARQENYRRQEETRPSTQGTRPPPRDKSDEQPPRNIRINHIDTEECTITSAQC